MTSVVETPKTHEVVKRTFELFSYATSGAKVFVVVVWEVLVYVVFGLHQWLKGNAWAVQGTGNDPTIGCLFARRSASYRPWAKCGNATMSQLLIVEVSRLSQNIARPVAHNGP